MAMQEAVLKMMLLIAIVLLRHQAGKSSGFVLGYGHSSHTHISVWTA